MARPSAQLVQALRRAARRIARGAPYQWGHHGSCNCGHLAQELTSRTPAELHAAALEKAGDWSEHARDYCPTSGFQVDEAIGVMLAAGLERADLAHLEDLSDPAVLAALPGGHRWLARNRRDDAVLYLATWADLLERELAPQGRPAAARAARLQPA